VEKGRKPYIIVILILLAAVVYLDLIYTPKDRSYVAGRLKEFPAELDGVTFVRDIKMDKNIVTTLDPSSLIFREYETKSGRKIWLCIVYHENERWGAHDPQVCYRSQGWDISDYGGSKETTQYHIDETGVDINQFYVKKGNVEEVVFYWWFGSKKKQLTSRFDQMTHLAINGLLYGYNDSGFIRVSTIIDKKNEKESLEDTIEFAKYISSAIIDYLPD